MSHNQIYQPGLRGDAERLAFKVPTALVDEPIPTDTFDVVAKDFEVLWDADRTFPFFEDDSGMGVYGYGHIDPAEYAAAVNEFDVYSGGVSADEANYEAGDVRHAWAVGYGRADAEEWRFRIRGVTAETPRAFPITWVSR